MRNIFMKLQDSPLRLYVTSTTILKDESGQDLVEYAILCALVATIAVAATTNLAGILSGIFDASGNTINNKITSIT